MEVEVALARPPHSPYPALAFSASSRARPSSGFWRRHAAAGLLPPASLPPLSVRIKQRQQLVFLSQKIGVFGVAGVRLNPHSPMFAPSLRFFTEGKQCASTCKGSNWRYRQMGLELNKFASLSGNQSHYTIHD
ncbi:uncharacterized protein LOC107304158 [Oryza brachyantha]|uniref:Uncharacterized protein n=1 Tax=Oryza brachyantha TaxID=4533 RepID=J3M4M1_ORYBR|nr:uncharacterized protein LOC107304158 [Oryza brachyantha]